MSIERSPIVPQCIGCERIIGEICAACLYPWAMWDGKKCFRRTHNKEALAKETKQLNSIKASKRKMKGA